MSEMFILLFSPLYVKHNTTNCGSEYVSLRECTGSFKFSQILQGNTAEGHFSWINVRLLYISCWPSRGEAEGGKAGPER